MKLIEFILILAALAAALLFGLKASLGQRKQIREDILANPKKYAGVVDVVKQKKMLQAENLLINLGRTRQSARMTVAVIRELIRAGLL